MSAVTVVGVRGSALSEPARLALSEARVVVGGRRVLDLVADLVPAQATRMELGSPRAAVAALVDQVGPVVVLAGGDPGWFGIVRLLGAALPTPPRVIPEPSSLSLLAAALGRPWDGVVAYSAHGRDQRAVALAVNAARALPEVAVLTGPEFTVADLAGALEGWPRNLTVGERLGHSDQRVTTCPAAHAAARDWAEPNLVLVTDPSRSGRAPGEATRTPGWALPESAFEYRDGMITKAEVRAVALAWLAPAPGRLVWDVGAGSGAVGIECARHGAAVICVDHDPEAVARVVRNASCHQVAVRTVTGRAPETLVGLPEPDAVFVGGGGPPVVRAVAQAGVPTVVVSSAALDHALAARQALLAAGYQVEGTQLAACRLAELPDGAVRLAPLNPAILLNAYRPGGRL